MHTFTYGIRWPGLWLLIACLLGPVFVQAKDSRGVHSEFFDPKYKPVADTLITPLGQPSLFAFTGRWHRYRDLYTASVWPGTYVTLLTFGDNCTLVLKPRLKELTNLTYTVTVDGGEPFEISSEINQEVLKDDVLITINTGGTVYKSDVALGKTLPPVTEQDRTPHVVKVTSSRHGFPLSLKGFYIPTSLVRQSFDWANHQALLPYVEFVGGPSHVDSSFASTSAEFKAAESLNIRHSHITTDECFSKCEGNVRSLARQYPRLSPVAFDPFYKQGLSHSGLYAFFETDVLQISTPGYVVLNVGDLDLAGNVPGLQFADDLYTFLKYVHYHAHPDAYIMVVLKPGRYVKETRSVVAHMKNPKIFTVPYPSSDGVAGWKKFLQKNVLPLAQTSARYRNALVTYKESADPRFFASKSTASAGPGSHLFTIFVVLTVLTGLVLLSPNLRTALLTALTKTGLVTRPSKPKGGKALAWD